jgi:CMP-N-acetylneuraminic acid synthetase
MIHSLKVIALVPIKGHSERVKGKNFRDFTGKPLYHHIVHTLDRTYAVDEIIINTDSQVVMNEAPGLSPKVRIIERPKEIQGDFVSMNHVIEYDLAESEADIYLQTHATNPLLNSETIAHALKAFVESMDECDSLFTVNQYLSRFYSEDATPVNHNPEELLRTQDLPPIFEENSCIYIFTKESFAKKRRRIGEKPKMFPTPPIESTDIDDEFTFRLAELLSLYTEKRGE